MTFTPAEKLAAVERELKFRRRVYARLVAEGKMTREAADHQTSVFQSIAADYRAQIETAPQKELSL